tara:strand:+ start:1449 stop:2042 length:594 start_codon:yes stop_codon:yes gene_type:complete
MKNAMNVKSVLGGLCIMAALLVSCSPEDGADGAVGPVGPQGQQGVAGADGPQGDQGETGTANVIYSDWIPSGFDDPITDDFDQFELDVPQLNETLQNSGVILVYARKGTVIYPIPVTFFGTLDENYNWRLLTINDDIIAVRINSTDGSNIGTPFLNGEYRYVLIPGGEPASAGRSYTAAEYESMTYEEVASLFNIKD